MDGKVFLDRNFIRGADRHWGHRRLRGPQEGDCNQSSPVLVVQGVFASAQVMSLAGLCKQGDFMFHFHCYCCTKFSACTYPYNESLRFVSPSSVFQSSDRSFDVGMYSSLCVVACVVACIYSFQYRAYKASALPGNRRWPWQSHYFLFMITGFITMAIKSALFLTWNWLRKNPDLLSAPKSSPIACNLQADVWTM